MTQNFANTHGSIDAHAHWSPQPYIQYAEQQGGKISGGMPSPLMYDLEARIQWMDSRNVKTHVLSLSGGMPWQWASLDAADKLARIIATNSMFLGGWQAGVVIDFDDRACIGWFDAAVFVEQQARKRSVARA